MSRIITIVIFLLISISARANHFTGGNLRYEYTGVQNQYRIVLTLYKTCEPSAIDLPSFINIYVESKKQNILISKNLGRVFQDTLQPFCPGTVNSCNNMSSQYPGYIVAEYADTIIFPVATSDWNVVFSNSSRSLNIVNLQGASGTTFYIDAPLNLAGLNNSSAMLTEYPPHVLFINDSVTIPLAATDADGDTVAYSIINPESAPGTNIPYYTGYNYTQPFGQSGLCYIKDNNTLVMKATAVGKYTIAIRMKEYRNGSYIGYTTHDFVVTCISSSAGSPLSIPQPDTRNNMYTFTCPGRSNYLSLNFTDPAPSDSIYMNIEAPAIPGFNFNTSANNGIGSVNGSVAWTTPLSMNPSSLPFFDIKVHVRDNACKQTGKATYIYRVNTRLCSADSVWPGDANTDKVVDMYDPLAIAMNYNDTGSARPNAATAWAAQYCPYWNGSFLNNIDIKHADCNGDGMIDTADLAVVDSNYSKTHPKGGSAQKTTAGTDLFFDHSGIHPNPDSTVSIKILLGNATTSATDFYGLATNVLVDGLSLATPPVISYVTNWIGDSTNTLNFTKDVSATSVDWVYARTNKQNVNGQGQIANLEFKIPASTLSGTLVTLSYNNTKIIDKNGLDKFDFNTLTDTFYVWQPIYISSINNSITNLRLYPNPSGNNAALSLHAPQPYTLNICITDVTGRVLNTYNTPLQTGDNTIPLPSGELPAGLYLIKVSSKQAGFTETLKWTRR